MRQRVGAAIYGESRRPSVGREDGQRIRRTVRRAVGGAFLVALLALSSMAIVTPVPIVSAQVQPPPNCFIRGREVRADDRAPIEGMTVSTRTFAGVSANTITAVTDSDGRWALNVPRTVVHYLSFSHPDYRPVTHRVVLDPQCQVFGTLAVTRTPEEALARFIAREFPDGEIGEVRLLSEEYGLRTYAASCAAEGCYDSWYIWVVNSEYGLADGWWNGIVALGGGQPQLSQERVGPGFEPAYWGRHGEGLTVGPDGNAAATWRIYRWCADDPTPPCDDKVGNEIIYGGRATIAFHGGVGATSFGRIFDSTDPERMPAGRVVALTSLPDGVVWLSWGESGRLLCGGPVAYLAAELIGQSCGA